MIKREPFHAPIIDACREMEPQLEGIYAGIQLGFLYGKAEQLAIQLLIDGNQDAVELGSGVTEDACCIYLGVGE